jgi:hypothetical protein
MHSVSSCEVTFARRPDRAACLGKIVRQSLKPAIVNANHD